MANRPLSGALPANLPTDWATNQIISPSGTDVGLTAAHGYNYQSEQINAAQSGVNQLNAAFDGLATKPQYIYITVPTSGWTATSGFYTQTVSAPGILASDEGVHVDIYPGSDNAANKLYAESWSKVQSMETLANAIKFVCTAAPTTAFPLKLEVNR